MKKIILTLLAVLVFVQPVKADSARGTANKAVSDKQLRKQADQEYQKRYLKKMARQFRVSESTGDNNAYAVDFSNSNISNIDGNYWRILSSREKNAYLLGFIIANVFMTQNLYMVNTLPSNYDFDKASKLWIKFKTKKKRMFSTKEVKVLLHWENVWKNVMLMDLLMNKVTSTQLQDGVDTLYDDFRNRSVPLWDAAQVVRLQIKGVTKEDVKRVLLYLRSSRTDFDILTVEDEQGNFVKTIRYP